MFTGIVQQIGTIRGRSLDTARGGTLHIATTTPFENPVKGESIAVNGVCLTLESVENDGSFHAFTLAETLRKTNLGTLESGAKVNLERALRPIDRLGGHFVSGHVDCTAKLISLTRAADDMILTVEAPETLRPYLVEKGSIAIDGVSLTIVKVTAEHFTVHLIPTTLDDTALPTRRTGGLVNLEADMIGKYVWHQLNLAKQSDKPPLTIESFLKAGW